MHIITKFLTIFTFDYEVICFGKPSISLEKALREHLITWKQERGRPLRLEFQVADQLGRNWLMSSLEWDEKSELIQVTLCASFERCLALLVEFMDIETITNRLKIA